jgi:hypothetical protein
VKAAGFTASGAAKVLRAFIAAAVKVWLLPYC